LSCIFVYQSVYPSFLLSISLCTCAYVYGGASLQICVGVNVFICVNVYVCVSLYTCHVNVAVVISFCAQACLGRHVCVLKHVCVRTYGGKQVWSQINNCVCVCLCVRACRCMYSSRRYVFAWVR
jgi:hypothetical protein